MASTRRQHLYTESIWERHGRTSSGKECVSLEFLVDSKERLTFCFRRQQRSQACRRAAVAALMFACRGQLSRNSSQMFVRLFVGGSRRKSCDEGGEVGAESSPCVRTGSDGPWRNPSGFVRNDAWERADGYKSRYHIPHFFPFHV